MAQGKLVTGFKSSMRHTQKYIPVPDVSTAVLKTLIDRFCSFNGSIQRKHMRSALLAVAWNSDDWTFEALESHYHTLVRYLNFRDQGMVLGKGCGTPSMTQHSDYPAMAYQLGKGLKD